MYSRYSRFASHVCVCVCVSSRSQRCLVVMGTSEGRHVLYSTVLQVLYICGPISASVCTRHFSQHRADFGLYFRAVYCLLPWSMSHPCSFDCETSRIEIQRNMGNSPCDLPTWGNPMRKPGGTPIHVLLLHRVGHAHRNSTPLPRSRYISSKYPDLKNPSIL